MAGQTLSASSASWKGVSLSFAYQWKRCDLSGGGCNPLGGATATTYKLGSADVGTTLRVDVTASNKNGSATATATQTAVVAPVPAPTAPPANTALPQISGTAQVGQTLTSSAGTWSGSPTWYAYQWKRCDSAGANCAAITGATASSYAVASGDVGSTLRAAVSATNSGGTGTAISPQSAAATPASGGTLSPFGVAAGGNIQWFSAADQARELDGMVTMGA